MRESLRGRSLHLVTNEMTREETKDRQGKGKERNLTKLSRLGI